MDLDRDGVATKHGLISFYCRSGVDVSDKKNKMMLEAQLDRRHADCDKIVSFRLFDEFVMAQLPAMRKNLEESGRPGRLLPSPKWKSPVHEISKSR
jgi:hypothetical protein